MQSKSNVEQLITPLTFQVGNHLLHKQPEIKEGIFSFLNRRVALGTPINWFPREESQLWLYNLHYFDYAIALGNEYAKYGDNEVYELFKQLVYGWIKSCPVAGPIAWDSYPVSVRLSNWIKAFSFFEPAIAKDPEFSRVFRQNLYLHATYLERNLENHLLGNHLIENGRALLLAGLFFQDSHSEHWQEKGNTILWNELEEQFLADGGHFERSPMYHQIMLNLYREVITVLEAQKIPFPSKVKSKVILMEQWMISVLHPDGQIPLLNDSAFGIAGDPMRELNKLKASPDGIIALPESGYITFRDNAQQNFLIFDCGPLGPDYQPGHGHCDALSFELSLERKRFIVDSGVGNYYGNIDWRNYYRSTRAHNTVVVDGAEQSEIWGRFRVARRAQPVDLVYSDRGSNLKYAVGSHTGYRRLSGSITHRRWMGWIDNKFWLVCDEISGSGRHSVESFIHFDPAVEMIHVPSETDRVVTGEVKRGSTNLKIIPWGMNKISSYHAETDPIQGWVAPEFGLKTENDVWGFHKEDQLPIWFGYVLWPNGTDVKVDYLPLDLHTCRINIHSAAEQYKIRVGYDDLILEVGQ